LVFFGGGRFAGDQVDAMRRGFSQHRRARPSNVGSTSKVCHNGSTHNSWRNPPGILNFAFCRGEIAAPVPIAALTQ
jgi:hypothetical protein